MFLGPFSLEISLDGEFSPWSFLDFSVSFETREVYKSLGDPLQVTLLDSAQFCVLGGVSSKMISEKVSCTKGILLHDMSGNMTDFWDLVVIGHIFGLSSWFL